MVSLGMPPIPGYNTSRKAQEEGPCGRREAQKSNARDLETQQDGAR